MQPTSNISMDPNEVIWTPTVKYLGVTIDSQLDIKNMLLLVKSVALPIMTYASGAWSHTCMINIEKFQENVSSIHLGRTMVRQQ